MLLFFMYLIKFNKRIKKVDGVGACVGIGTGWHVGVTASGGWSKRQFLACSVEVHNSRPGRWICLGLAAVLFPLVLY